MRMFLIVVMIVGCGPVPVGPPDPPNAGGRAAGGSGQTGGSAAGGTAGGVDLGIDRQALSGTRLRNRYIEGDDGSRTPLGFFDTMRNEACAFADADDGRQRCLPLARGAYLAPAGREFADAACMEPVANSDCAAAVYAYTYPSACPTTFAIYDATAYTPTMVYRVEFGQCNGSPPVAGRVYYRVGAKVPSTSFVAGTIKIEQ